MGISHLDWCSQERAVGKFLYLGSSTVNGNRKAPTTHRSARELHLNALNLYLEKLIFVIGLERVWVSSLFWVNGAKYLIYENVPLLKSVSYFKGIEYFSIKMLLWKQKNKIASNIEILLFFWNKGFYFENLCKMLTLMNSSCFLIEAISEIQSICITSFDFSETGFDLPRINDIFFLSSTPSLKPLWYQRAILFLLNVLNEIYHWQKCCAIAEGVCSYFMSAKPRNKQSSHFQAL